MAGAGGTGQPKQPEKLDQIEALREALIPEILKQISGGQPTPPQYQPTPISPQQGFAIARNPQQAGLINQTIQAPGQAQFQRQQAAFEQAMQGRQQAMTAGTSLLNAQTGAQGRTDRYNRPQLRMVQTQDDNGNPVTVPMEYDPQTGSLSPMQTTTGQTQFPKFVPPKILPTTTGFERVPTAGPTGPVTGATTGQPLMPVPSAQMVSDITTQENLRGAFGTATKTLGDYMTQRSSPARVATGYATDLPLIGGKVTQAVGYLDEKAVNTKQALDRVSQILNYLVSGKQISEQEYGRLRPNIPEIGDSREVAAGKMERFNQELDRIEATRGRLLPGLTGGAGAAPTPQAAAPKRIKRSAFNTLPPAEQQRALRDGVQIIEGQ